MTEWLLRKIGVDEEIRAHLDQAELVFQRPVLVWLGLALLIPLGWYIYQRQRSNLASAPPALARALTATRVVILLVLVLILAGPYLRLHQRLEKKPIVALLFDHSQSMGLPAGPFESDEELLRVAAAAGYQAAGSEENGVTGATGAQLDPETRKLFNQVTRAQLARDAVEARSESWLAALTGKFELRCYALTGDLAPITAGNSLAAGKLDLPQPSADGPETHLGDGLAAVLEEAAGRPVAGIVLFSDGQNTGGRSPQAAARAAAGERTTILAVPVGSSSPIRDIAVVDVFAPDLVSVGDTVHVSVTVEVQGYPQQAVKVELLDGAAGDPPPAPLDSKELLLKSSEQQHVDLAFQADKPGARTLTVRLQPVGQLSEDLADNNADTVMVRVSDEKLRILYVEGLPRWDFRFLKNAMRRDHGLGGRGLAGELAAAPGVPAAAPPAADQTGQPPAAGPTTPSGNTDQPDIVLEAEVRRLPADEQAVLPASLDDLAQYHTVVLGDVSPNLVDSKFVELLAQAVRERGLGLLVAAGPLAMPHAFGQPLLDLLPVRVKRGAAGMEAPVHRPFRIEISPDGAIHESTRLYDEPGRNQSVWSHMPSYYWCAAAERASPAATVLAYNSSVEGRYGKLPLVAHHYAGQGKVMFVGTDSTWLWRQNVGERFFYKFWGQAIRYVARRDTNQLAKKSWLEVRPVKARPGEQARLELMAFSADGSPRREPTLAVAVADDAGAGSVEMTADKSLPGRYVGRFSPRRVGTYRFVFEPGGSLDPVEAHMHVHRSTEELRRANVNVDALAQLGSLVQLDELDSIPSRLSGQPKLSELYREASIWDNWLTLTLLALVYSLDVGLRRLAGLS